MRGTEKETETEKQRQRQVGERQKEKGEVETETGEGEWGMNHQIKAAACSLPDSSKSLPVTSSLRATQVTFVRDE